MSQQQGGLQSKTALGGLRGQPVGTYNQVSHTQASYLCLNAPRRSCVPSFLFWECGVSWVDEASLALIPQLHVGHQRGTLPVLLLKYSPAPATSTAWMQLSLVTQNFDISYFLGSTSQ